MALPLIGLTSATEYLKVQFWDPLYSLHTLTIWMKNMLNKLWKFADDTKLSGKVSVTKFSNTLRADLSWFVNWSATWLMPLNVDKCKIIHLSWLNFKEVLSHAPPIVGA